MRKIVCNHCGGKWYIDNIDLAQIKCCLYCQRKLRQKKEITTLDTLDKVIFKAISVLGPDALSQPRQLAGYMMDTAPEFRKELRILTRVLSDEYYTMIRDAFIKDVTNAELLISKLRTLLIEDDGLSESWADTLCNSYMGAIRYYHGIGLEEVLLASVEDYEPSPAITIDSRRDTKQVVSQRTPIPKKTNTTPTAIRANFNIAANYRCRICGYRANNINTTNDKCPLCKSSSWESIKHTSKPNNVPDYTVSKSPDPKVQKRNIAPNASIGDMLAEVNKLLSEQNYTDAFPYLQRLAQKNSAEARYEIGKMYHYGTGVVRDYEKADEMLCDAAKDGYAPAMVLLGQIRFEQKKYASSWRWFLKAAEKGDPTALFYQYFFYTNGYHVAKNEKCALRCLEQALAAGSVDANLYVGKEADRKKDYATAICHFLTAANAGNPEAQYFMGIYFLEGKGTTTDLLKAASWLKQAVDQGYKKAEAKLQNCVKSMTLIQKGRWSFSQ